VAVSNGNPSAETAGTTQKSGKNNEGRQTGDSARTTVLSTSSTAETDTQSQGGSKPHGHGNGHGNGHGRSHKPIPTS
jgi:hypothetical protein